MEKWADPRSLRSSTGASLSCWPWPPVSGRPAPTSLPVGRGRREEVARGQGRGFLLWTRSLTKESPRKQRSWSPFTLCKLPQKGRPSSSFVSWNRGGRKAGRSFESQVISVNENIHDMDKMISATKREHLCQHAHAAVARLALHPRRAARPGGVCGPTSVFYQHTDGT